MWEGRMRSLTWIRKVGILWGHHAISLEAREGSDVSYGTGYMERIEVDGEPLSALQEGAIRTFFDDAVEVKWVAEEGPFGNDRMDVYEVTIKDVLRLRLQVVPEIGDLRTEEDAVVHFNMEFVDIALTGNAHGVLGQTYRPDFKGRL